MSVTILEALQNADHNFRHNLPMAISIAKNQLHNAVTFLEKGYSLHEEIDPLLEKWPNPNDAPEKE
jgi:hypothetical protein